MIGPVVQILFGAKYDQDRRGGCRLAGFAASSVVPMKAWDMGLPFDKLTVFEGLEDLNISTSHQNILLPMTPLR